MLQTYMFNSYNNSSREPEYDNSRACIRPIVSIDIERIDTEQEGDTCGGEDTPWLLK